MTIHPGDIFFADIGAEEVHRVVVVSREELNRGSYVVVVPFSTKRLAERSGLANCVSFVGGAHGLTRDCVAIAEQIAVARKDDLDVSAGCVGKIKPEKLRDIIRAIGYSIEAVCEPE